MIKPDELKVGLLIWWTSDRTHSSWSCPGVITKLDKEKNKYRVKTFDTFEETDDLLIERPAGGDPSSLHEMSLTTPKKVFEYLIEQERSFAERTTKLQAELDKAKQKSEDYSKYAQALRKELGNTEPVTVMPVT